MNQYWIKLMFYESYIKSIDFSIYRNFACYTTNECNKNSHFSLVYFGFGPTIDHVLKNSALNLVESLRF